LGHKTATGSIAVADLPEKFGKKPSSLKTSKNKGYCWKNESPDAPNNLADWPNDVEVAIFDQPAMPNKAADVPYEKSRKSDKPAGAAYEWADRSKKTADGLDDTAD
jgi:hypothetical protein